MVAVENVAVGDRVSVRRDLAREGEGLVGIRLEAGFDQRRSVSGRETCERGSRNPLAGGVESHHGEGVLHLGHQAGQRLLERSPGRFAALLDEGQTVDGVVGRILEFGDRRRLDDLVGGHVLLFGRQPDLRGARRNLLHADLDSRRNGSVVDVVALARRHGECRQKAPRRPW